MFQLCSQFAPAGDQPKAIKKLVQGLHAKKREQALLGVTGSGKTFTMANVIAQVDHPTLVMSHNKTLAAQLYQEFKAFFPHNAVHYFVSYYDYYQPEAYIPHTDTYIEKEATINEEIDRLRHAATQALLTRRDVIIVASVSCIYGIGSREDYLGLSEHFRVGDIVKRNEVLRRLILLQYERNDIDFHRGRVRARGSNVEIFLANGASVVRLEMFGDKIEKILIIEDYGIGERKKEVEEIMIFPAKHFVTPRERLESALILIQKELNERVKELKKAEKFTEAERLERKTNYDMEMMREVGYCNGIENYSRLLSNRAAGSPPETLVDFFPSDYLLFIDESHVSLPQIGGMSGGDRARKDTLVEFGFRLPSARDNRPLTFKEFNERINQVVYVSATPGDYEMERSSQVAEQIVRPTGLLEPKIEVRKTEGQVKDLIREVSNSVAAGERILVTTLTKRMAEELSEYLVDAGIKSVYLHSEVDTLERIEILKDLRAGKYDCLVGVNLLREGLDLPEVALIAILDADIAGFLRNKTSLIQTIGRAARNINGRVIMYADKKTPAMRDAINETNRRRKLQEEYNKKHGIIPQTIKSTKQ